MSAARFIRHHVLLGLGEVRWRRQKNRNYLRLKLKNSSSFRYRLNCLGNTYWLNILCAQLLEKKCVRGIQLSRFRYKWPVSELTPIKIVSFYSTKTSFTAPSNIKLIWIITFWFVSTYRLSRVYICLVLVEMAAVTLAASHLLCLKT